MLILLFSSFGAVLAGPLSPEENTYTQEICGHRGLSLFVSWENKFRGDRREGKGLPVDEHAERQKTGGAVGRPPQICQCLEPRNGQRTTYWALLVIPSTKNIEFDESRVHCTGVLVSSRVSHQWPLPDECPF